MTGRDPYTDAVSSFRDQMAESRAMQEREAYLLHWYAAAVRRALDLAYQWEASDTGDYGDGKRACAAELRRALAGDRS